MKIQALIALAGAALAAGCVVAPAPYAYYEDGVAVAPAGPAVIYEPSVVIVERGVIHNRAFYLRHPEVYRRDRLRYPERFRPIPPPPRRPVYMRPAPVRPGPVIVKPVPSRHGPVIVKPVPGRHGPATVVQPGPRSGPKPGPAPQGDRHKKRHHGDDDRDDWRGR